MRLSQTATRQCSRSQGRAGRRTARARTPVRRPGSSSNTGRPILPPTTASTPADLQQMMDQGGGGRLAVGAGDAHHRRSPKSSANRSTSPRIGHAGGARRGDHGVRLRVGERHAGARHQQGQTRHVRHRAGRARCRQCITVVVERQHFAPASASTWAAAMPLLAIPRHADLQLTGEARQAAHRSFNVERPTSARMMAMIQNRITIVGSCQPIFSK